METERWGDEEEIGMDVDMTEEEQLALITEINSTRNHLTLASSLESFGDHTTEPLPLVHSVSMCERCLITSPTPYCLMEGCRY